MKPSLTTFQRVMLGIILLEIPLRLDAHLQYHEAEAAYGALGGWNVSLTTICLGVLYAAWLIQAALRQTGNSRWWVGGIMPGLVYVGAVALSVAVAQSPLFAMFELFSMLQAFLIFLYLFRWVRSDGDVRFIVSLLMVGLILESTCMLGLYAVGRSIHFAGIFARVDVGARVGGTVGSPNEAASYLTLMLSLALGVILAGWSRRSRLLACAGFALGAAALVTTQSRGGWLGFGLALCIFLAAALVRRRISLVVPVVVSLVFIVAAVAFQDMIRARLTRNDKGAAYSRVTLMEVAVRVIQDAPILGAGANNFAVAMLPYSQSSDYRGTFMYVVHNRHLQVWAETGLVGLAAWLVFLWTALSRGWRAWRANDVVLAPLALGAFAGIAGEILHMSGEVFGGRSQMQMLWVLAALTAVLYRLSVSYLAHPQLAGVPSSRDAEFATAPRGSLAGTAKAW